VDKLDMPQVSLEEARVITNGFLKDLDFTPIGRKRKTLLLLLTQVMAGCMKDQYTEKLPKGLERFEFLKSMETRDILLLCKIIQKEYDKQKALFDDMVETFGRWAKGVSKKELAKAVQGISYPEDTELLVKDQGVLHEVRHLAFFLKSPGITKWVEENTKGEIECDKGVVPLMHRTEKERAAAFAKSILFYDKHEAMFRGFTKHHQIQTMQVATYVTNDGKRKSVPIKKPGLLLLYLILKRSEKRNVTLVSVEIPHSMRVEDKKKYMEELKQQGIEGYLSKSMEALYNSIIALDKNYKERDKSARFYRD